MTSSRDNPPGLFRTRTDSSSSSSSSTLASPIAASFSQGSIYPQSPGSGSRNQFTFVPPHSESDFSLPLNYSEPQVPTRSLSEINQAFIIPNETPSSSSIRNVRVNSVGTGRIQGSSPSRPSTVTSPTAKSKESTLSKAKLLARQAAVSSSMSGSKRKNDPLYNMSAASLSNPNTSRVPIVESTPLARPSKELERIASSMGGTQNALLPMNPASRDDKLKIHHHHLVSFRSRKDAHPAVVLSSSSSNSKLVSDQGSIYTFNPSTPGMLKSLPALENKKLVSKEDKDYVAEETWTLLKKWVLPLFNKEGLRIPVEKVNFLVTLHIDSRIQQDAKAKDLVDEFKDLTNTGMVKLISSLKALPDVKLMARLVELWYFFFSQVLPYWEAVFLPLQLEFEGAGSVLSTPGVAAKYWSPLAETEKHLNIRRMTLISFRDCVLLPISTRLDSMCVRLYHLFLAPFSVTNYNLAIISQAHLDFDSERTVTDTTVRLLQCANVLASIQSSDASQLKIEHLVRTMKNTWLSRSRTAKDRRGFVSSKPVYNVKEQL